MFGDGILAMMSVFTVTGFVENQTMMVTVHISTLLVLGMIQVVLLILLLCVNWRKAKAELNSGSIVYIRRVIDF